MNSAGENELAARAEAASQLQCVRQQIDEITCLLERQAPCPQVLRAIFAAQITLQGTQHRLLQCHLRACLESMPQLADEATRQQPLADILELYAVRRRCAAVAPIRRDSVHDNAP